MNDKQLKKAEALAIVEEIERRRALKQALPREWKPRPYQRKLWKYLIGGGKRAVEIAHRRWGKDDVSLHWTCKSAHERIGNYWHMLPEASQARKAIWEAVNPHTMRRRIDEAFPSDLRAATRDSDMMIRFKCGSTWQVVGSDNFDSLVGSPPVGLVFSEWALADPRSWSLLRPILDENGGWAIFITTPRGKNHAHGSLVTARKSEGWFSEISSVLDTKIFNAEKLKQIRFEYVSELGTDDGNAMFEQEFMCSFDAPLVGAYYATQLREIGEDHFLEDVPIEPEVPVQTAWDLGHSDDTVIWWFQVVGGEIRIIDYYSEHGQDVAHYCDIIHARAKERGFTYGPIQRARHWVPWDAKPKTLASPRSIVQQARERGVKMRLVPNLKVEDGIQAVRQCLPRCYFDMGRCEDGVEALRNYKREWDDDKKVFKRVPRHDWASHSADAFRYLALAWQTYKAPVKDEEPVPIHRQKNPKGVKGVTLDHLFKDHDKKMRAQAEVW